MLNYILIILVLIKLWSKLCVVTQVRGKSKIYILGQKYAQIYHL